MSDQDDDTTCPCPDCEDACGLTHGEQQREVLDARAFAPHVAAWEREGRMRLTEPAGEWVPDPEVPL